MSRVTSTILTVSRSDEHRIVELNRYFEEQDEPQAGFRKPPGDDWYGGSKSLGVALYFGAFNYIGIDDFTECLNGIAWDIPEEVVLLFKTEDEEWHLFKLPPRREAPYA